MNSITIMFAAPHSNFIAIFVVVLLFFFTQMKTSRRQNDLLIFQWTLLPLAFFLISFAGKAEFQKHEVHTCVGKFRSAKMRCNQTKLIWGGWMWKISTGYMETVTGSCACLSQTNPMHTHGFWFTLAIPDSSGHRMWTAVSNPEYSNRRTVLHSETASRDYCKQNFANLQIQDRRKSDDESVRHDLGR